MRTPFLCLASLVVLVPACGSSGGGSGGGGGGADGGGGGRADASPFTDGGGPVTSDWITVAPATFTMGSPESEPCRETDEVAHSVTLTRSFQIWNTEVTQRQYQAQLGYNPSAAIECGPDCPVENLNWHMAAAYCNALSTAESLAPCYVCSGANEAVTCATEVTFAGAAIYDCAGYRLPTDAEWELAYRAGSSTSLYNAALPAAECNTVSAVADAIGWYSQNADDPHEVGQRTPNALGIYDMAGNVQEFMHDYYQANLGVEPQTDPVSATPVSQGIIRGGSAWHGPEDMRGAHRKPQTLVNRGTGIGVRCVRSAPGEG